METNEKRFEYDIEEYLITEGGYEQFVGQKHDAPSGVSMWIHNRQHDVERCIYMDVLIEFIEKTQPKVWEKYKNIMAILHLTDCICDWKRLSVRKDCFMF